MRPSSTAQLAELLEPLRSDPSRSGVCCDFDGTLSPIVTDPAAARPLEGVFEALSDLAGRYATVAVVSGRPLSFLQPLLPPGLVISGLYGLESVHDGERREHATAGAWREAVADVVAASRAVGPDGMLVEPKDLSLTLHYRSRPDLADDVRRWASTQAARAGLAVREARMSVELHPPVEVDKGTALRAVVDGLGAVCFIGDDRGDLPAFDALDVLATEGVAVAKIVVASDESPAELVAAADAVVAGPAAVLDVLRAL